MEKSINKQSGGTAAETLNINSNQQPDPKIDMKDNSITLKEAAAQFACAASSLKNNIKSGKLAAIQTGEKAPYMVRLFDVERFLRATPGIVSNFHPAASKSTPGDDKPAPDDEAFKDCQQSAAKAPAIATAENNHPVDTVDAHEPPTLVPDVQVSPHKQASETRVKRRRRRGKGGAGSPSIIVNQQPMLKALAGTTPEVRLRITACLTEFLGLVALA